MTIRNATMWVKLEQPGAPVLRALLGEVARAEITIFDLANHVVHHTIISDRPAGNFNGQAYYDYAWNGPKSKGIYYAEVKGECNDGIVQAKTKFAVAG